MVNSTDWVLQRTRQLIEVHGWSVMYVGAGRNQQAYGYTVGLSAVALPELAVVGLPHQLSASLLNEVAAIHVWTAFPLGEGIGLSPREALRQLEAAPSAERNGLIPGRTLRLESWVNGPTQFEVRNPPRYEPTRPRVANALYGRERVRVLEVVPA